MTSFLNYFTPLPYKTVLLMLVLSFSVNVYMTVVRNKQIVRLFSLITPTGKTFPKSMKRISLVTDEWHPINLYVHDWLVKRGYSCNLFGSFKSKKDESWVLSTNEAAHSIINGASDEGIFFCW